MNSQLKKILLVCFGGLGDVILFYPLIKTVKDLYPDSLISILVEPRSKIAAEKNSNISKVITFDLKNKPSIIDYLSLINNLRNEKFDIAISMGKSSMVPLLLFLSGAKQRIGYSTNKLKFLYTKSVDLNENQYAAKMYFDLLKGLGIDTDKFNPIPEIKISKNDIKWAEQFIKNNNLNLENNKIVVVHPGASKISKEKNIIKTWSPIKWASLINHLILKDIKVILTGGPDDKKDISIILENVNANSEFFINAYGITKNLEQFGAILKFSNLLVCIDSAPMNVGIGVGVPIVAIFGPTNEKKLIPNDEKFTPVRLNLECTPCLWDKRQTTCESLCCLKQLEVENVLEKILEKLNIKCLV